MVSIVIPVYNQAEKLIKTLESILAQSYQDFEVIIVDDGSQDGVEERFAAFSKDIASHQRFLFLSQANQGAPAARNRGRKAAQGDFLFFCDADAILKPEALGIMVEVLVRYPEASYTYSSFHWGKKLFKCGPFDASRLRREPYIHTMSLVRTSDFPVAGWDTGLKKFQDWDIWLTMLGEGKTGIWIDQSLFKVSPGGTISSWVPSFTYTLLPFLKVVKKYKKWKKILLEKHGLSS